MIDFSRIEDEEYYNMIMSDIGRIDDNRQLSDILKSLSIKISNKEISPDKASNILGAVKDRMRILTNDRFRGGKKFVMSPTVVSDKKGRMAIVLLVVNVAVVSIMYTFLWIANFIK